MITEFLRGLSASIWNYPVVGLCLLAGSYFTLRLGFVQVRMFPHAVALLLGRHHEPGEDGQLNHFQALSAALSGTVGVGNMAGVAVAIAAGGPGATLWMILFGMLGMATKLAECSLGTHYRVVDPITGEARGGPMYYITRGLGPKWKPMAVFFSLCAVGASFGFTNMFQSNQAAAALNDTFGIPVLASGLVLAALVAATIIGGITRIGLVASYVVPVMCGVYVLLAWGLALFHWEQLPGVIALIVEDAFSGDAVAGGSMGAVIVWAVRRAVFSNEAGLGSSPMAHATVKTAIPVRQGIVASLEPFIDTVVVCSATALVLVLSGAYGAERFESTGRLVSAVQMAEGVQLEAGESLRFACPGETPVSIGSGPEQLLAQGPEPVHTAAGYTLTPCSHEEHRHVLSANGDHPAHGLRLGLPAAAALGRVEVVTEPKGVMLTARIFENFFPGVGGDFVSVAVILLAFSTMITWSFYGEQSLAYVFGDRARRPYKVMFCVVTFIGAVSTMEPVLYFSDVMCGLMVVPNTIAILLLRKDVIKMIRDYRVPSAR